MSMIAPAAVRLPQAPIAVHADPDPGRWNAFVARNQRATAYHRIEWKGVVERAFRHETRYLTAETDIGVVGILPLVLFRSRLFGRFAVSMPFANYGGVVADSEQAAAALLAAAVDLARKDGAEYLELRHTGQLFPRLQAKRHKVGMTVALQASPDDQWQAIDRKLRNQVRKAEKSGLTVVSGGEELLARFYGVFARNMRDLGTPVYSIRWFQEILRTFPASSRIFAVSSGEQTVAASFMLWKPAGLQKRPPSGATIEVPWASALREFNPLCPNVFLYWHMMRFAIESGFSRFDLGRCTPGEGTFHFKKQWGAEPQELVWEYWTADGGRLPDLSPKNPKFARAIAVWQRLPVGLTKVLGPPIVRHIA
jgi:FemAB-related protein (PEP-CTERM system-associated)